MSASPFEKYISSLLQLEPENIKKTLETLTVSQLQTLCNALKLPIQKCNAERKEILVQYVYAILLGKKEVISGLPPIVTKKLEKIPWNTLDATVQMAANLLGNKDPNSHYLKKAYIQLRETITQSTINKEVTEADVYSSIINMITTLANVSNSFTRIEAAIYRYESMGQIDKEEADEQKSLLYQLTLDLFGCDDQHSRTNQWVKTLKQSLPKNLSVENENTMNQAFDEITKQCKHLGEQATKLLLKKAPFVPETTLEMEMEEEFEKQFPKVPKEELPVVVKVKKPIENICDICLEYATTDEVRVGKHTIPLKAIRAKDLENFTDEELFLLQQYIAKGKHTCKRCTDLCKQRSPICAALHSRNLAAYHRRLMNDETALKKIENEKHSSTRLVKQLEKLSGPPKIKP